MHSFTITSEDDGVRLNRFLQKCAPQLPASLMYRALRSKRIKLNGRRCEASDRLRRGDVLELYLNDDLFSAQKKQPQFMSACDSLETVYEDENILIINKPAGVIMHADKKEFGDTLVNRMLKYLYKKGEYTPSSSGAFTPAFVNRLDRNTEGIVLAAKNSLSLAALARIVKERLLQKSYICVTVSKPPSDGRYSAYLTKDEGKNTVSVSSRPCESSKEIVTEFKTLAERNGLYLCSATLVTGRAHQIRAHLKHLGAPILGDEKYGRREINSRYGEKRQLLCSYRVSFKLSGDCSPLEYLDGKSFALERVGFAEKYFGLKPGLY